MKNSKEALFGGMVFLERKKSNETNIPRMVFMEWPIRHRKSAFTRRRRHHRTEEARRITPNNRTIKSLSLFSRKYERRPSHRAHSSAFKSPGPHIRFGHHENCSTIFHSNTAQLALDGLGCPWNGSWMLLLAIDIRQGMGEFMRPNPRDMLVGWETVWAGDEKRHH